METKTGHLADLNRISHINAYLSDSAQENNTWIEVLNREVDIGAVSDALVSGDVPSIGKWVEQRHIVIGMGTIDHIPAEEYVHCIDITPIYVIKRQLKT